MSACVCVCVRARLCVFIHVEDSLELKTYCLGCLFLEKRFVSLVVIILHDRKPKSIFSAGHERNP